MPEHSVGHLGAQFHALLIKAHRFTGSLENPNTSFDVHREVQDAAYMHFGYPDLAMAGGRTPAPTPPSPVLHRCVVVL